METSERIANELAAQRNQALNAAAIACVQRDEAVGKLDAVFVALDQCIFSGQVPDEDVPKLISSIAGFAEWRAKQSSPWMKRNQPRKDDAGVVTPNSAGGPGEPDDR